MTPYEEIAQLIIRKQMLVLGEAIAVERAKRTQGLELDAQGNVKFLSSEGSKILENLLNQYYELLGPAGLSFAREAALGVLVKNPTLAVPPGLREDG